MSTTVIEELEQLDNSFRTRWGKDLKSLSDLENWWYQLQANIGSNRSTTCESDMSTIGLFDTFAVTVKTTKKAISDKRYLEPLNSPPTGWCVMGLTTDRKASTIVVQYIKESDYLTSENEIINEFLKWSVNNFIGEIKETWERSISDLPNLMTNITTELEQTPNGNTNYQLDRNFATFEEIKNIYQSCGSILYHLNEETINQCIDENGFDRKKLQYSIWRALNNLSQPKNQQAGGRLRFNYLNDQWVSPNSKHQIAFNWREGEKFPQSVWSDMTYSFVHNP